MDRDALVRLLEAVAAGHIGPEEAAFSVGRESDLGFAVFDDDRAHRTGSPEIIYGPGKTPEQIALLLSHVAARGELALATRVDTEKAAIVAALVPEAHYEPVPRLVRLAPTGWAPPERAGTVCVCTGGTSDLPVSEEAARILELLGWTVDRATDVGVAGIHRLLSRLERLRAADVVIAVAGMEGALPSVVAGLVSAPVIAVPTSVGYGTALSGLTPLLAMLTSCAAGIVVVNVDNGFGAAQAAHRILSRMAR
jgi:NCAIR mutase (PurE)-related protein